MSHIENIVSISNFAQRIYGRWLFKKLLPSIAGICSLIIVISIMISLTLSLCLTIFYFGLLYYGVGQLMALLLTGILAMLLVSALIFILLTCLQNICKSQTKTSQEADFSSTIIGTLAAFTDGLMAEQDIKT
jgi:hypothetical protein